MNVRTFTVKSPNVGLLQQNDGAAWMLDIQNEDGNHIEALLPDLTRYPVIIDDEPYGDTNALSRVFNMSPYNHYECLLHCNGVTTIADTVVVRNSLLDDEVLHRISFGV